MRLPDAIAVAGLDPSWKAAVIKRPLSATARRQQRLAVIPNPRVFCGVTHLLLPLFYSKL